MPGMNFVRERNRVEVDAYTLMIAPLRDIWQKDRTKTREKATAILSYIHLSAQIDPDAPFFGAKQSEVKQLAARNLWRDNPPKRLEQFDDVIKEYINAYETPEVRMMKTFNNKIDEIQDELEETKPKITENYNDKTGVTTYASNIPIITKGLKDIDDLLDEKEKLEQRIKRQTMQEKTTLGQKKPSLLEEKEMYHGG